MASGSRRTAQKRASSSPNATDTRTALLDAAESLLVDEGYVAVTSRRVAERADANSGLVYYYFKSMDDLLIELFRRRAEEGLERQAGALQSPQPLWALWDALRGNLNDSRTLEFFALARHHPAIRKEVGAYSAKYRTMQLEVLSEVLESYDLDLETWPPVALILAIGGIALLLLIEDGYGFDLGHAELVTAVERQIRELEGDRWTDHPAIAHRRS